MSYDLLCRSILSGLKMLKNLLGSANRERVLIFIFARGEGYARDIASFFKTGLDPIQKQLDRLESGGILASREVGRTRPYTFNPRYPLLGELKQLLDKTLSFYPSDVRERLVMNRRRPRRRGKPL
jgi:hypothetical protein